MRIDEKNKTPAGRSWFFGIGINDYSEFPALKNAVKDVQDVANLLSGQYDIDPDHTILLFDQEATRKKIITQLDRLKREVQPTDKLIIYFSGHGHLDRKQKGYWIPIDAEKANTAEYIRNSTIRDYIEDIDSLHTLLISDACFSGSLFVEGTAKSSFAIDELELRPSRWAICSGRHDEEVYDGPPGANSPFASSILDVLNHNSAPKLNVSKFTDHVLELTRANYKQLPEGSPLYGVGHKGGQYVFRLRRLFPLRPIPPPAMPGSSFSSPSPNQITKGSVFSLLGTSTLGWGIAFAMAWGCGEALLDLAGGKVAWGVGWGVGGAVGGFFTGLALRFFKKEVKTDQLFLLAAAWAIAWVLGRGAIATVGGLAGWIIGGAIVGGLGGAITDSIVPAKDGNKPYKKLFLVAGWILAWGLSWGVTYEVAFLLTDGQLVGFLGGLIGGAIGAIVFLLAER